VPKLVWRVKLVTELQPRVMTETEVAQIVREQAGVAELGLWLEEARHCCMDQQLSLERLWSDFSKISSA